MNIVKNIRNVVLAVAALWVVCSAGCATRNHDDLQEFMTNVKNKPHGAIEPLPPLRTYEAYVYNVTAMRSPFEQPVEQKEIVRGNPNIKPDLTREREYLESFGIDSLSMVGTLEKSGEFWALVLDGDGIINRVAVGNFMGRNHGEVRAVSPTQVDLVEIVPDGLGGWLQRPRSLKLSEQE